MRCGRFDFEAVCAHAGNGPLESRSRELIVSAADVGSMTGGTGSGISSSSLLSTGVSTMSSPSAGRSIVLYGED